MCNIVINDLELNQEALASLIGGGGADYYKRWRNRHQPKKLDRVLSIMRTSAVQMDGAIL